MRRYLIIFALVACYSAQASAGSIYDVNAWATFTGTLPCSTNCTETIGLNFLYIPPPPNNDFLLGTIVPGTMNISSSGFLGTFSDVYGDYVNSQGYIPFANNPGLPYNMRDELDLNVTSLSGIQLGMNTLNFDLFYCFSVECKKGYGDLYGGSGNFNPHPNPTSQSSVVTRVAVPDGTPFLPMVVTSVGVMGLALRWRRKNIRGA